MSIANFYQAILRAAATAAFVASGLVVATPASAQIKQELSWCEGTNPELQIEGCTTLIELERLPRRDLAFAHNNRGIGYYEIKDFDDAILDFSTAVRLYPEYAAAYDNRGNAFNAKGEFNGAIADYTKAIALDPKKAFTYRHRGLAYFYVGDRDKALADLNKAIASDSKDAYSALWLDIIERRNKIASHLPQAVSHIDMMVWPAPVIRMFLGRMAPAAVLVAADDADAVKKIGQVCEANFYSGELALLQGTKDVATRLFRLAARDCPKDFDEWIAANLELKALGMAPVRSHG